MKNNKAFILIELVMTIVVVGIISIPMSVFICENYRNMFQTSDYSTALDLARNEIEIVNNTAFDSVLITTTNTNNYHGYPYYLVRTVSYALGNSSTPERLIKITVDVKRTATSPIILTLVTYRARNISHGL